MSSKAHILAAIRTTKPGPRDLPTLPQDPHPSDLEQPFREVLTASKTHFLEEDALLDYVLELGPDKTIVSTVAGVEGNLDLAIIDDPLQLAGVDLAILHARLGVAENGAMWLSETEMMYRVLPFITQHLILVLEREQLVPTMHVAYRRIDIGQTGFGVFVAGPSKTADIEQSLVIGAQGPRSLTVVLR